MSGIAGVFAPGARSVVDLMLDKITHRGPGGRKILETSEATLGIVWTKPQEKSAMMLEQEQILRDVAGNEHVAEAKMSGGTPLLMRDSLGVAPLYYGTNSAHILGFASEVKALAEFTRWVKELPPGCRFDGKRLEFYFTLQELPPLSEPVERIIEELQRRLTVSIEKRMGPEVIGSWLSGGLDSSTLAALVRPHVRTLHTFAAGLTNAPDLEYAREVAAFINAQHHEVILSVELMLKILPKVIYHLESFDALLVRSSITNYMAAKAASEYVAEVFSGEGGDELFGGYEYLKRLEPAKLPAELIDITNRLHNTALQRVDRSAAAHGTVAHVAFLDPELVDYAHRIPAKYKIHDGVEKWILRQALAGKLPERVLNRTKAKFWEGAGVQDHLAQYAEKNISTADFNSERQLANGWILDSKEELMYYRIFKEHFGNLEDFSWMGRTKKSPEPVNQN